MHMIGTLQKAIRMLLAIYLCSFSLLVYNTLNNLLYANLSVVSLRITYTTLSSHQLKTMPT